jgi:hypothetical protein
MFWKILIGVLIYSALCVICHLFDRKKERREVQLAYAPRAAQPIPRRARQRSNKRRYCA